MAHRSVSSRETSPRPRWPSPLRLRLVVRTLGPAKGSTPSEVQEPGASEKRRTSQTETAWNRPDRHDGRFPAPHLALNTPAFNKAGALGSRYARHAEQTTVCTKPCRETRGKRKNPAEIMELRDEISDWQGHRRGGSGHAAQPPALLQTTPEIAASRSAPEGVPTGP